MALNPNPDWRCTNRIHAQRTKKPKAAGAIRSRESSYPDILLRCHPCIEDLKDAPELWDVELFISGLKRRPDLDRNPTDQRVHDFLTHIVDHNRPTPQPAD